MDQGLDSTVKNIITKKSSCRGVVVADDNGLCLVRHGISRSQDAGYVSSVIANATKLGNGEEKPIVSLESQNLDIIVESAKDCNIGVYLKKTT